MVFQGRVALLLFSVVKHMIGCLYRINSHCSDFLVNLSVEVILFGLWIFKGKVSFKGLIRKLVPQLILSILFTIFLYGIIGEVNKRVVIRVK